MTESQKLARCEFCGKKYLRENGGEQNNEIACDDCGAWEKDADAKFNVRGLCDALTLTRKDLGVMTGKSPADLREYWEDREDRFVQIKDRQFKHTVRLLLLVQALATKLCQTDAQTRLWMRASNPSFEERTPASMIAGGRLGDVVDKLIDLTAGS